MCDSVHVLVCVFLQGYYGYEYLEPSLTFMIFLRNGPFVDCSRQNELINSGTLDVRLDFECKENVPKYNSLLSHHTRSRVQYNPLINVVRKIKSLKCTSDMI